MSENALPTTPQISDTTLSITSTENSFFGNSLAQQLLKLQQENIVVGKQNQELALQLHDASTYNQALGFDLYQLDQEIGELEAKLSSTRNQIKQIDEQTKNMMKKADEYKNALLNDSEFASLARRLRALQKTHQAATKGMNQLRDLLGDPHFSMLDGALQLMQEKIHFLYWSNTELHQQIELMQQLLNEGREGTKIEEELEKLNDISTLKLEWLEMRLYESQLKEGKKSKKTSPKKGKNIETTPEESTKFILSPTKNNRNKKKNKNNEKDHKETVEKNEIVKIEGETYQDVTQTCDDEIKKFRRPMSKDGKEKKYQADKKSKKRRTRVQNKDGDEYEYEYEYEKDADGNLKNRKRVHPKDEEVVRIDGAEVVSGGFAKIVNKENGETTKVRKVQGKNGQFYEDILDSNSDIGAHRITRRPLRKDRKKRKYRHIKNRKIRRSRIQNNEGEEYEIEYEYNNNENDELGDQPTKKMTRVHPKDEEVERIDGAEVNSEGFAEVVNTKSGQKKKMRKVKGENGDLYEDTLEADSENGEHRITRVLLDKDQKSKKYDKSKNKKRRRSRIQNKEKEEYEYEYEYDTVDESKNKKTKVDKKNEKIEKIERSKEKKAIKKINKIKASTEEEEENEYEYDYEYDYEDDTENDTDNNMKNSKKINNKKDNKKNNKKEKKKEKKKENKKENDKEKESEYQNEYDGYVDDGNENEEEEFGENYVDSEGFSRRKNEKTNKIERYRRFECEDGKEYEDVEFFKSENGHREMKRNQLNKKRDGHNYKKKRNPKTGRIYLSRHERVLETDGDEYEYDYQYDEIKGEDQGNEKKEASKTKHRVPSKKEEIPRFSPIEDSNGFRIEKVESSNGKHKKKKVRRISGENGVDYKDTEEKNSSTGEDEVKRRIIKKRRQKKSSNKNKKGTESEKENDKSENDDELSYSKKEDGKLARHSRVHHMKTGQESEYEYEYETDENGDKISVNKIKVENSEDEVVPAIVLKSELRKNRRENQGFENAEDPATGKKIKKRKVDGKNGDKYEDVLESDSEDGAQRITRRIVSGDEIQYQEKHKKGKKQPIRVRRSRVQNDDKEEYEYEYEYDDENKKNSRSKIPKNSETIETIGDGPIFEFEEKIDCKTGESILTRHMPTKDNKLYEDALTKNADGIPIVTRRIVSKSDNSLQYDHKVDPDSKKTLRIRHSKVQTESGNEEEFEYEHDDCDGDNVDKLKTNYIRKFVPKEDEIIDSIRNIPFKKLNVNKANKNSNNEKGYQTVIDQKTGRHKKIRQTENKNGQKFEYSKEADAQTKTTRLRKKKIGKNKYQKVGKNKRIRKTEVNIGDSEKDYEYEYDDDEGTVTRREMPKKDEDGFYGNGINTRIIFDKNGDEYEDTLIDGKVFRRQRSSHLDKSGKVKNRHTRVRNNNDEEYEYEYENEDDVNSNEIKKKLVKDPKNEIIPKIKLNTRPRPHKIGTSFQVIKGREVRHVHGNDGNDYEDVKIGNSIKRTKLEKDSQIIGYKNVDGPSNTKRRQRHSLILNSDGEEFEYEYEYDEENHKSRKLAEEIEIESLLKKTDFLEKIDPKTGKTRYIRQTVGSNGDIYEDEEDQENKKIIRRKLNDDEFGGFSYFVINAERVNIDNDEEEEELNDQPLKQKRIRHSRVRNQNNGNEYEYEYEYDDDITNELVPKKTKKRASSEILEPIERSFIKRYVSDSSQYSDEEDPTTGKVTKTLVSQTDKAERIIDPKNGKHLQTKQNDKNYTFIVYPESPKKTLRRRKVKLINNDELEIEYDDDDVDEDGNAKRTLKRIINEKEHLECDPEGFCEMKNGMKVKRVKGKNGSNYIDTVEKGGRIKRRVVRSASSENLEYFHRGKKMIRHSRVHSEEGEEREYEYEYNEDEDNKNDEENEDAPKRRIVKKNKEIIDQIKENDFQEAIDQETGGKIKIRKKKGKNGEIYEDILDNKRITRRPLDKNGENIKYSKGKGKRKRHTRVRNENFDEYEYEYEYNENEVSDDDDEQKPTKKRVHPKHEEIERIDGSKVVDGGFVEQFDETKGQKKTARKVKGKKGQMYEDELVEEEKDSDENEENNVKTKIKRKPLNKKGNTSYRRKNDKIVRQERVKNDNDEEYEYEYEYDDDENKMKRKVNKKEEKIEQISDSEDLVVSKENIDQKSKPNPKQKSKPKRSRNNKENQNEISKIGADEEEEDNEAFRNSNGFTIEKVKAKDGKEKKESVRRVSGSNGENYKDTIEKNESNGTGDIKRRVIKNKDKKKRRRIGKRKNKDNEYEYEYEYDDDELKYSKKKDGKLARHSRVHHMKTGQESEYEYEYETDAKGDKKGGKRKKKVDDPSQETVEPIKLSLLNVNEQEFKDLNDPKTHAKSKIRHRRGRNGEFFQDTLVNTPEKRVIRRPMKPDYSNYTYSKNGSNKEEEGNRQFRRSRVRNDKGEEFEYEYEYDDETGSGGRNNNLKVRTLIENPEDEIIEPISIVHRPRNSSSKSSPSAVGGKNQQLQFQQQLSSEGGIHLPVALFLSEDKKPTLRQSTPAFMQQPRPVVVDLSEFENAAKLDKNNPLSALIPKLRAEAEMDDAERLQMILEALQQQIAERTIVRDQLKEQVKDLESPAPKQQKKRNFKFSGVRRTNIEAPPDPLKVLALNDFNRRSSSAQTDITGESLVYQQSVLEKQRKEKRAAEELRVALENLKAKIRTVEDKIELAKEDGQQKENRIKALKNEIANVKDELLKEDTNALREEEKSREYAQQLAEMDEQIRVKQQQLERVNSQVGALHLHLKEMQRFRVILEAELADLVNREKPEIRQLIEDVKSYRVQIDVSSANVETMTKKVEAKRQQLETLLKSDEMNQYNELKLRKMNLERRIKKWTALMKDSKETLQSLEVFSAKNAAARKTAIENLKNKTKVYMKKETELEDLEKYQELVETMIREHKQNWM